MSPEEWIEIKRMLLQWPQPHSRPIDDGAYRRCLQRFDAPQVASAIEAMVGVRQHTPLASEIAAQIADTNPAAAEAARAAGRRRQLAEYEARAAERWAEFAAEKPELANKVMADIERQHGKPFAKKNFLGWKGPIAVEQSVAIGGPKDGN